MGVSTNPRRLPRVESEAYVMLGKRAVTMDPGAHGTAAATVVVAVVAANTIASLYRRTALALVATVVLDGLTPAQCLRMALIQTQYVPQAVPVGSFSEPSASG